MRALHQLHYPKTLSCESPTPTTLPKDPFMGEPHLDYITQRPFHGRTLHQLHYPKTLSCENPISTTLPKDPFMGEPHLDYITQRPFHGRTLHQLHYPKTLSYESPISTTLPKDPFMKDHVLKKRRKEIVPDTCAECLLHPCKNKKTA